MTTNNNEIFRPRLSVSLNSYTVISSYCAICSLFIGSDEKREYCYLSPAGRIYFTAIPIGVLLLFNIVALVCTIAAIKTVQKVSRSSPYLVFLFFSFVHVSGLDKI